MARTFSNNNYLADDTSAILTSTPLTMAAWGRSSSATASQYAVSIGNLSTPTQDNGWSLNWGGNVAGDPIRAVCFQAAVAGIAATTTGYSANTWHHGCAVFTSNISRDAYIDGGSKGSNTTDLTPTGLLATRIGAEAWNLTATSEFAGEIAEVGIWNVALGLSEIEALAAGISPIMIRPESLVLYVPIIGRSSPEINLVGASIALDGTPPVAAHPRIIYPRRRWVHAVPAAGEAAAILRPDEGWMPILLH